MSENYINLEVRFGFINRKDFGFRPLDEPTGAGCIYGIDRMHEEYLGGKLQDDEESAIDNHIGECLRCEGAWEARTSRLEDTMLTETKEDDDSED